jgi:hypothetical protein
MPLKLYPVPLVVTCEIVRAVLPEFVIVCDSDFVDEIWTVPKFSLVGLAVKKPEAFPVPSS